MYLLYLLIYHETLANCPITFYTPACVYVAKIRKIVLKIKTALLKWQFFSNFRTLFVSYSTNTFTHPMYFLKKKIGKEHVDLVDKNQRTALHWAASIGAADYVELLLKIGANANLPDAEGKLPLHWALSLQKSQNEKVWT